MVGLPARACGLGLDVRHNFPYSIYRFSHIPVCTWAGGDCFARAYVRWMEIQHSMEFLREQLRSLPSGQVQHEALPLGPNKMVVAMTEGWRGQIVHIAQTDDHGRFAFYKVIDPSFYNWFGLAMAMRNQQISDFPVCNKSFNLSYCGHDL
jgi:Ni,Fe-hydrogenase III large subunit